MVTDLYGHTKTEKIPMPSPFIPSNIRRPNENELLLIKKLIEKGGVCVDVSNLKVSDLDDGHMGSLLLFVNGEYKEREAAVYVSEIQFKDVDGVAVIATLYSNKGGIISELDIWKVNFEPLIKLPYSFD